MKFNLQNKTGYQAEKFFRELGYKLSKEDETTGEMSFVRSLTGDDFPRLHIYAKEQGENIL